MLVGAERCQCQHRDLLPMRPLKYKFLRWRLIPSSTGAIEYYMQTQIDHWLIIKEARKLGRNRL